MQDMTKTNLQAITAQTMGPGSTWEAAASMKAAGQGKAAMDLSAKANNTDFITQETATNKAAKRDSLVNIHVGIGSSHSKSVTEVNETTYAGGSIQSADGTVRIIARGDSDTTSNADTTANGNITAIGQTIQGKVVDLQAKGDVNLLAGTNTTHITEDSKSSGWSVGASIGTTGFLGGDIGINKAKSEGLTDRTTHTGTTIVGTEAVTITSEKDTNIVGSTVSGNKVVAKVGNDLTITSVQDTDNYKSTSKTSGISISYTPGHAGIVSGGTTKGDIHSQYRSVTSQAGIYAGTDGYDITVKDNTTLTGSVIDSEAASNVNRLTTGSLTMKDIDNEASYAASSGGFNISTAKGTGLNPLGLDKVTTIPVSGDGSSTTRSAIADGIISVADTQSVSDINHNTKEALQTLGQIFDKKKVEEKQELVNLMAKDGYTLIGDISVRKAQEYITKAERAEQQGHPQQAERYREEAKKWSEGGTYKLALHGSFGAVLGAMSGNGGLGGATAATTNEAVQAILGKVQDGEVHKLLSEVVGTVVSGRTGGAIANAATEFNWLSHADQENFARALWSTNSQEERAKSIAYFAALDAYNDAHYPLLSGNNGIEPTLMTAFEQAGVPIDSSGLTGTLGLGLSAFGPIYQDMGYFSGYDYAYGYRTRMERGYGGRTIPWSVESQEMANPGTSPDTVFDGYSFRNSYDIMALLKNAGSVSSNGYVIDKSGREHTELGLVGDYLLNRKLATLVYSNDGVGYARSQWGDIVTSNRQQQVVAPPKEKLSLRDVRRQNAENVAVGAISYVHEHYWKNVDADYSSVDASVSAPILGAAGAEVGGSLGMDKKGTAYGTLSIGGGLGVGLGAPVSVGVSHQNFVEDTSDWKLNDYRQKIAGQGSSVSGNVLGIQQGVGIANKRITSYSSGTSLGGEIGGVKGTYSYTWVMEAKPPVTMDEVKSADEDDDSERMD